jgi:hypothetical protein
MHLRFYSILYCLIFPFFFFYFVYVFFICLWHVLFLADRSPTALSSTFCTLWPPPLAPLQLLLFPLRLHHLYHPATPMLMHLLLIWALTNPSATALLEWLA